MKVYLIFILIIFISCGQNCNDLPYSYKNYEEAKSIVSSVHFEYEDDCNVSDSSFITSADYYSCDEQTGFLIIGMNTKNYIFQNVPFQIWKDFKEAESKGKFYNRKIRGRYKLSLK